MKQESSRPLHDWLPITKRVESRGLGTVRCHYHQWRCLCGSSYIWHSCHKGRIIENEGFRVGIIPQPNWKDDLRDFKNLVHQNIFWRDSRVYGFHGQSLYSREKDGDLRMVTPGGASGFDRITLP